MLSLLLINKYERLTVYIIMCIKLLQNQTKKYTHEVHASNTCRDKYLIQ